MTSITVWLQTLELWPSYPFISVKSKPQSWMNVSALFTTVTRLRSSRQLKKSPRQHLATCSWIPNQFCHFILLKLLLFPCHIAPANP